jgi:hypothetical protein
MGLVGVDSGPRCRDDFRMEGGYAAVAAELSAVAATVAGHVPELSSETWALLTQDVPEFRAHQSLACEHANASVKRYFGRWTPDPVRRARHSAGFQVSTDRVCD